MGKHDGKVNDSSKHEIKWLVRCRIFLNCYINREFLAACKKKIENVEWYFQGNLKCFLEQLNFN